MKAYIKLFFIGCLASLISCKDENESCKPSFEYDPSDPRYICKAPDVSKNIVGSWKFETNLDTALRVRTGYVTFDATSRVIDPDFLIENSLDRHPIKEKKYAVKEGKVEVYQFIEGNTIEPIKLAQTYPFSVKTNFCNRIELELPGSFVYVTLTR